MPPGYRSPATRISLIGGFLLALLFIWLAWSGWQRQNEQWQAQLSAQSELQRVALLQSQHNLRQQALRAAQGLASDPDTLRLIRRIALLAERYGTDDAQLLLLRAQLEHDLQAYWKVLRQGGAHQLHIHLALDVISLLRMHRPERWGDSLAQIRPLVVEVQQSGQSVSGLELGRFDSGIRGVVPIRAEDNQQSRVVASIEVGLGMLPQLQMLDSTLDAGVALLLNASLMQEVLWQAPPRDLLTTANGMWLLDGESRSDLRDWMAVINIDGKLNAQGTQLVSSGGQRYLLTSIPLRDHAGESDPQREYAAILLAWQNVTPGWLALQRDRRAELLKWSLALLASLALLVLLFNALRRSLERQMRERHALQQQMQQQRLVLSERLQKLSRHLPGVIYQFQLSPSGHSWYPWASGAIQDIYGISPEQAALSADTVFERILPEDRDRVSASIVDSAQTLRPWQDEYRVLHPTRGELWLSGNASPERLANGDTIWHGYIADITSRKHIELELEHQRQRLAEIIQATRAGTWEADLRSGAVQINARWTEIIGYRPEELEPMTLERWAALAEPEGMQQGLEKLRQHLEGEKNYHEARYRLRHRDGHWVWVEDRGQITARNDKGRPVSISGTTTDITEAYEAQQAKARFISTVSHELRTPLTAINGAIGLLAGGALGSFEPAVQNLLQIARNNGQNLVMLINDLLDLDRLQSGKLQLSLQPQRLRPLLEGALQLNQPYADNFAVRLVAEQLDDAEVLVDSQRLLQVLANLLSNAAKFSHSGGEVQLRSVLGHNMIRVSVTDHGIGIDPQQQHLLFRTFSQIDSSDARQRGGSGLGLSICRDLIERMNGSIGVDSEAGTGSCFWFELPLAGPASKAGNTHDQQD